MAKPGSGAKRDRPELVRMLDSLRDEDVVVVIRLDRLARSTKELLEVAALTFMRASRMTEGRDGPCLRFT